MARTTSQVITELVGSFETSAHSTLYVDAFSFVADLIPADSELWQTQYLQKETGSSNSIDIQQGDNSYRILRVNIRFGTDTRICKEISYNEYLMGLDVDSIHYHGASQRYPVWTIRDNGRIVISPPTSSFNDSSTVYYFKYPTDADAESLLGGNSDDISNTLNGFPKDAHYLACIKASINILQAKINETVQEDEDSELLQLLQVQSQSLQQLFESEGRRLGLPFKKLGIDEA